MKIERWRPSLFVSHRGTDLEAGPLLGSESTSAIGAKYRDALPRVYGLPGTILAGRQERDLGNDPGAAITASPSTVPASRTAECRGCLVLKGHGCAA